MPETLMTFAKARTERSYRKLWEQIESLTAEEALQGRQENHWPGHKWGIGQDGSIVGLVYHTAAWKQMTLPVLKPGGKSILQEEFDVSAYPQPTDWEGVRAWFQEVGVAFNEAVNQLQEADWDRVMDWEVETFTVGRIVVELYEHDIQHTAQIEYLRQLYLTLTLL